MALRMQKGSKGDWPLHTRSSFGRLHEGSTSSRYFRTGGRISGGKDPKGWERCVGVMWKPDGDLMGYSGTLGGQWESGEQWGLDVLLFSLFQFLDEVVCTGDCVGDETFH